MYKGCIFDLDGTLVNSLIDLGTSMNTVLEEYNLPVHEMNKYNQFVGNGVKKLVERALGKHTDLLEEAYQRFNEEYAIHYLDHTLPYDGINDLLQTLNDLGIKCAVVTNKPHRFSKQIVNQLFPNLFVCVYGEQVELYPKKPDPESCYRALKEMGLDAKDCIYIGDSDVDVYTGKNAGMDVIGVEWGFRGRLELLNAGADYTVRSSLEILDIVK